MTRRPEANRKLPALLAVVAVLVLLGLAGGWWFVRAGYYDVSALTQNQAIAYRILDEIRLRSISRRAADIDVPQIDDAEMAQAGFDLFLSHCESCHGGPGQAPASFALGMEPAPTPIVGIARKRQHRPQEMFWIISNGIKMTGMPAWKYRLSEQQIWQVVAFVQTMPYMTPLSYRQQRADIFEARALTLQSRFESAVDLEAEQVPSEATDDALLALGIEAIGQYACGTCHRIPGISNALNDVGPPLGGISDRSFIAGELANTLENLVFWIRYPTVVSPETAMPDLGVSARHARAIALYLRTRSDE